MANSRQYKYNALVDDSLQLFLDALAGLLDDFRTDVAYSVLRTQVSAPACDDYICRGQHLSSKHPRVPREVMPDGVRPNRDVQALRRLVCPDARPAAQPNRLHVRHGKVRAHAANLDERCRLARKARREQHPDICGRPANVDDDRRLARLGGLLLVEAREERRPAHRVGWPRREGADRQLRRGGGRRQRAVVLGEEERAGEVQCAHSVLEAADGALGEGQDGRVEDGRILAFQEADLSDCSRQLAGELTEVQLLTITGADDVDRRTQLALYDCLRSSFMFAVVIERRVDTT